MREALGTFRPFAPLIGLWVVLRHEPAVVVFDVLLALDLFVPGTAHEIDFSVDGYSLLFIESVRQRCSLRPCRARFLLRNSGWHRQHSREADGQNCTAKQ